MRVTLRIFTTEFHTENLERFEVAEVADRVFPIKFDDVEFLDTDTENQITLFAITAVKRL